MSESAVHSKAIIQPAGPVHLAAIASLAAVIWRTHYPGIISHEQIDYMLGRMYDEAVMRRELESGIAYDRLLVGGELRGFSSYGPTSVPGELKLHKLYMHPGFQRRGLGNLLLKRVEAAARDRDFTTIVLAVNKRNAIAVGAYRKHGFLIRDSVVTDIGSGFVMDDYVMAKPVVPSSR